MDVWLIRENVGLAFAVSVSVSVPGFRRQRQGTAISGSDRRLGLPRIAAAHHRCCHLPRTPVAVPVPAAADCRLPPSHSGTAWRCQAPPQMLRSRAPIRFRRCLAPARAIAMRQRRHARPSQPLTIREGGRNLQSVICNPQFEIRNGRVGVNSKLRIQN